MGGVGKERDRGKAGEQKRRNPERWGDRARGSETQAREMEPEKEAEAGTEGRVGGERMGQGRPLDRGHGCGKGERSRKAGKTMRTA